MNTKVKKVGTTAVKVVAAGTFLAGKLILNAVGTLICAITSQN